MEKLYRVKLNNHGAPDFSTAVEVEPEQPHRRYSKVMVEGTELMEDGTLTLIVWDATKIRRVLIEDAHHNGGLYYADESEQSRWISCEEQLPADLTNVLVWTKDADVGTAFFFKLDDDESDFMKTSPTEGEVIAWMPFPAVPREGSRR